MRRVDGKGRPGKPARRHVVPLVPKARAALKALGVSGQFAISTDGGVKPLRHETLSGSAADYARKAGIERFQARRIRGRAETALGAAA